MPKCFYCDTELIWGADFDAEEIYGEGDEETAGRIVSTYTCPHCGAEYEVLQPNHVPPKNMQS